MANPKCVREERFGPLSNEIPNLCWIYFLYFILFYFVLFWIHVKYHCKHQGKYWDFWDPTIKRCTLDFVIYFGASISKKVEFILAPLLWIMIIMFTTDVYFNLKWRVIHTSFCKNLRLFWIHLIRKIIDLTFHRSKSYQN